MEIKDGSYKLIFSSLDRFYKECDEVESTGNKLNTPTYSSAYETWDEQDKRDQPRWVGLGKEEILRSKYLYKEGLYQLKEIEEDMNLGGTKRSYKWDENDGDDMSYDRYLDDLPCLKKRIRTLGSGRGKMINIHVSVAENCGVSYEDMLNRSYTVMRLIDYLENQGYRVGVYVYSDTAGLGYYKDNEVQNLHVEIQIKKPEEPLIKGLVLTCISPWMLRYHMFKLWTAKFKCNYGLGHSVDINYEDTDTDIYFRTGSCLSKEDANAKLKSLSKRFSFSE